MYARVTWLEGPSARAGEAVRAFREQAVPVLRAEPGFEELLFLVDRDSGRALALSVWSSREDLDNSEELARRLRALPVARWSVEGTERFEVAVRERRAGFTPE